MLQRAASNAYSWWWASHIRTKQSRWLDNDLQEMEGRVKSMLKIIEEDADSFAKRAEMYYKRRPELINFVEEAYRAYRALADRYDHISGELHKANHTIATAFPDHVQFETQDEDDYTSPKDVSQINTTKIPRPPATIPQVSFRNKTRKIQSTPKKPHHKIIDSAEKAKAQEEIDKIQKRILVLQTEKEFIKSSYENGLTKYWDIEKQIAEMQEEVFHLQNEFNASSVIEDDEARALMAATALKSCEDTLINLQEQQKRSSELARIESRRIEDAKEKLKVLKGDSGRSQFEAGESFNENKEVGGLTSSTDEEVYLQERHELDSICEKIREHFETSSDMSVGELAEKIDDLVNKVISLEVIVSSQTVQIDRLKSETDELQKHLHSLEEEKLNLLGDSNTLSDKLRQAEEELIRIQDLEKCVQDEKKVLHTHFTEACDNLNELSEKMQSPKHENVLSSVKAFQDGEVSLRECSEREEIDSQDTREEASFGDKAQRVQEPGISQKARDDPVISVTTSAFENDSEKLRDPEKANTGIQDVKDDIYEEPHGVSANVFSPKDEGIQVQSEIECQLKNDSKILEDSREEVTKILMNQDSLTEEEVHMSREIDLGLVPQENQILAREGSQIDNVPEQSKASEKEITTIQNKGDNLTEHKDHVIQEHNRSPRDKENHVHRVESGEQELGADFFKDLKQENEIEEKDSTQAEERIHLSSVPVTQLGDQEGSLNWQQLLLNRLEGREKILLNEYTSILRNYKETKKRLCEAERKNQDYHLEMMAEIGELKSANAVKDEEILFLRQKLSSLQVSNNEDSVAPLMEVEDPKHGKVEKISSFPRLMAVSSSSRRLFSRTFKGINVESEASRDASFDGFIENPLAEDGIKLVHFGEPPKNSALEEKFRRDIDTLLEENLDFWLRFSTTFHHVQKFQTTFEDLQSEIEKLKNNKTQEGSSNGSSGHSGKSESAPIEKQLRELKTELQVWLEQNAMLRGELQKRFASICDIQEEITNVLKSSESEVVPFTPYQAAKFQGEVLNMQQENNKVADELQLGLDHVRALQLEIEKTLSKLHENSDVHGSRSSHHHYHIRNFSSKTILPLRALVFGAKPKKSSIFQCMNPALQKQYSDLRAAGLGR